jgi:transglutaminase-like putative cysteine protease
MVTQKPSQRWWDWWSVALLFIALITAATRLYATHWTAYLERVQYLTFIGIIAGAALGVSRFSPRVVKWIALAYTLFAIPWQLGETLDHTLLWVERLWVLGARFGVASSDLFSRRQVHDPILFLTLMAVLFWLIGLVGGYCLFRYGQVWPAVLPAGIALIVIDHYDPGQARWAAYLGIFLFTSLLLLGRMTYLRYRAEWQAAGVSQSPGTGADISRAALMAVVVLVLFAWTVPAVSQSLSPASQLWVRVSKPFDSMRTRISNAFSSLQSSIGVVSDVYGSTLPLGTGTRLGNNIVFTVKTSTVPEDGMRFYWRARSYNVYDGGTGWTSTMTQKKTIPANGPLISYPQWKDRKQAQFTFTSNITLNQTLYTPASPLQISRPGSAVLSTLPDGTSDIGVILANPPVTAGQTYIVNSWVSMPTIADLLSSGTDYPQYIKDNYFQLPNDLSPRFAQLAQQITAGAKTPYDKADAITQYLRRTITYSESIPNPPSGEDPIEWFLFDYKKGYCDYYATAEVLLLRELGIPARLTVGFAQGQVANPQAALPGVSLAADSYIVRYKDSHAWPEVYFNDFGWVEFEPTVSQPVLTPPTGDPNNNNLSTELQTRAGLQETLQGNVDTGSAFDIAAQNAATFIQSSSQSAIFWVVSSIGFLCLAGFALHFTRRQAQFPAFPVWLEENLSRRGWAIPGWLKRWAHWSLFSPLQRAYGSINQALSLVGHPARPSQTPAERSASLEALLPQVAGHSQVVLTEYQNAQYGKRTGDEKSAREASQVIRKEAWKAYFMRLLHRR